VVAFGASGLAWRGLGLGTAPDVRDRTEAPVREFATRRGQQAAVTLADGSRVTLGPDTRMRVHTSAAAREVELTGEAVFDVRHDAARPFVVRAAHAVTEDLGTTFGVRAYPGDSVVRVVVTEGAVALRAVAAPAATGARLGPGDVARLDRAGLARVDAGGAEAYLAWTRGRVAFRNAVLSEVAAELERRYDVAIRFARPTDAQRRITVDMPAGTLAEVLDAVTVPLRLGYRRDGGVIVVDRAAH
jgi:transmembrane sensor